MNKFSGFSPAAGQKTAGQIEKETDERRTSNVEHRTSNKVFYRFQKVAATSNKRWR
jgi:hypothetical protein